MFSKCESATCFFSTENVMFIVIYTLIKLSGRDTYDENRQMSVIPPHSPGTMCISKHKHDDYNRENKQAAHAAAQLCTRKRKHTYT